MKDGPAYNTTKRWMKLSFIFGWLVIFLIILGGLRGSREAVELAGIVVPSMILLIAAMLGIHRYTGSMDFRAMQDAIPSPLPSPYEARDQPPGEAQ
jgi:hypothetical protein